MSIFFCEKLIKILILINFDLKKRRKFDLNTKSRLLLTRTFEQTDDKTPTTNEKETYFSTNMRKKMVKVNSHA